MSEEPDTVASRKSSKASTDTEDHRPADASTTEDSVFDVINREDTRPVIVRTVALFGLVGVALGIVGYVASETAVEGNGGFGAGSEEGVIISLVVATMAIGFMLALLLGQQTNAHLTELREDLVVVTGMVGTAVGGILLVVIVTLGSTMPTDALAFADFFGIILASTVLAGLVGAGSVWLDRRL